MARRHSALVAAVGAGLLAISLPALATSTPCQRGISPETARRLFDILNRPPAEPDCKFEGVGTDRATFEGRWSRAGAPLPPIRVVPRECAPQSAAASGTFAVDVPREIGESCPSVVPLIEEFLKQVGAESPGSASERDPLYRTARALFAAIVFVALGLLARASMRVRADNAPWIAVGLASFCAAVAVRAAVPFSLGNWYSEVLPATGPPLWMRFGPGFFAFQSLLRDARIWNPRALELSQILIGAAAMPLLLGVLRELRIGLPAAAASLVLFLFAPFHARLSATASEHVLASTLCLALLFCWLRAARSGEWVWLLLSALLFPAICATRIDMTVQALLVLPWPFLRDRVERQAWSSGRLLRYAVILAIVAVTTAAIVYRFIAIPSNHPMPERAGQLRALRLSIQQFWILSTSEPGWVTLSSVLLAMPGVAWMALRRPLLLVRVSVTVVITFVALGRTFLHDELVGARYFLFTIPILLIVPGQGFEALLALVPKRARPAAATIGVVLLGVWTGLEARAAYEVRYAFQDEYTFARSALAQLPAGCVVYEVPIRDDRLPRDVDCCLDVPRSPLVLDFPDLRFLNLPDDPTRAFGDSSCVAYYESIACEIAAPPGDAAADLAEEASAYFRTRCTQVRQVGHLEPVAESTTSALATENLFHGRRPHVGLYRWRE